MGRAPRSLREEIHLVKESSLFEKSSHVEKFFNCEYRVEDYIQFFPARPEKTQHSRQELHPHTPAKQRLPKNRHQIFRLFKRDQIFQNVKKPHLAFFPHKREAANLAALHNHHAAFPMGAPRQKHRQVGQGSADIRQFTHSMIILFLQSAWLHS